MKHNIEPGELWLTTKWATTDWIYNNEAQQAWGAVPRRQGAHHSGGRCNSAPPVAVMERINSLARATWELPKIQVPGALPATEGKK